MSDSDDLQAAIKRMEESQAAFQRDLAARIHAPRKTAAEWNAENARLISNGLAQSTAEREAAKRAANNGVDDE
jgi:hypothetical protein